MSNAFKSIIFYLTLHEILAFSNVENIRLALCSEIITVHSKNHKEDKNSPCEQHSRCSNIEIDGEYSREHLRRGAYTQICCKWKRECGDCWVRRNSKEENGSTY